MLFRSPRCTTKDAYSCLSRDKGSRGQCECNVTQSNTDANALRKGMNSVQRDEAESQSSSGHFSGLEHRRPLLSASNNLRKRRDSFHRLSEVSLSLWTPYLGTAWHFLACGSTATGWRRG